MYGGVRSSPLSFSPSSAAEFFASYPLGIEAVSEVSDKNGLARTAEMAGYADMKMLVGH